jgi:VanZ family protein
MVMALAATAPGGEGSRPTPTDEYESGICNIGPDEIAHRLTLAHIGLLITLGFLVLLLVTHVPLIARFSVALPAWGTAVAYLQAWRRFFLDNRALSLFNNGRVGTCERVTVGQSTRRDRRRALEIVLLGLLAGVVVGAVAVLLPL